MKKVYITLLTAVIGIMSFAATVSVGNSGNNFVPDMISITEGDTVDFTPIAANHNVVEVSLANYNMNVGTSNGGFQLPFGGGILTGLTAGTYYYVCQPHIGGGMKGQITVSPAAGGPTDLIITGVFDGQPSWAGGSNFPKGFEIHALNAIPDLSIYGVGSANNGGGTDGEEFTFPAVSAAAGDFIYVASNGPAFMQFFGFAADYVDGAANINGDDAIELFMNGNVVDVFGDINVDGTGEPWEYLDGWAYRVPMTGPDGSTFVLANWTFSAIDDLQGDTSNATSMNPFPIGTYGVMPTPTINVDVATATVNEGDGTVTIGNLLIAPNVTVASTVDIALKSGTGSAADLVGITFPLTVNVGVADMSLSIPVTLNDDAVYEGTETIEFVMRNATGDLTIGNDSILVLTIMDNELPPDTTVSVAATATTANEGDGTTTVSVAISQLSAAGNTFTVDLALSSGDATDIDNYTTQTLSFAPGGALTQDVTVTITDDMMVEGDETFTFELVNPSAGLNLASDSITTLTLTDNDVATSSIAAVTTIDAGGNIDSLGVMIQLTGIVNSPDRGFNSIEFSIQDATGSITVYSTDMAITYDATVGDEVEVVGTISERFGVTIITDITMLNMLTAGNAVDTLVTTVVDETNESTLIRYNALTLVDPAEWAAVGGAGFDVRGLNASNDTINIRIDRDYDDLYNSAPPVGEFDLVGVLGQFDIDSPFVDNYQIIPRFLTDVISTPLPIVDASIDDINNVNAAGEPDSLGRVYRITGTVNSPDRGFNSLEFSMQDNGAGITIFTNDPAYDSFDPQVGDIYEIVGSLAQNVGVIRLEAIQSITELSTGNPLDENTVAAQTEDLESTLIRIDDLTLVDASQWAAVGGAGFTVQALSPAGDTVDIRIDRDYDDLYNSAAPTAATFDLIGVAGQFDFSSPFDEGYQIIPRFLSDIIENMPDAIATIELKGFAMYPNPTSGLMQVTFEYDESETITIDVVDALGRVVSTSNANLVNGSNNIVLDFTELASGLYFIEIRTAIGTQVTTAVKN